MHQSRFLNIFSLFVLAGVGWGQSAVSGDTSAIVG